MPSIRTDLGVSCNPIDNQTEKKLKGVMDWVCDKERNLSHQGYRPNETSEPQETLGLFRSIVQVDGETTVAEFMGKVQSLFMETIL